MGQWSFLGTAVQRFTSGSTQEGRRRAKDNTHFPGLIER